MSDVAGSIDSSLGDLEVHIDRVIRTKLPKKDSVGNEKVAKVSESIKEARKHFQKFANKNKS